MRQKNNSDKIIKKDSTQPSPIPTPVEKLEAELLASQKAFDLVSQKLDEIIAVRTGGKKPHKPTAKVKGMVRKWSAMGAIQEVQCVRLGITKETFRKYYQDDYILGRGMAVDEVAKSLYSQAISGNVRAQEYYLNTVGRWTTKTEVDVNVTTEFDRESFAEEIGISRQSIIDNLDDEDNPDLKEDV